MATGILRGVADRRHVSWFRCVVIEEGESRHADRVHRARQRRRKVGGQPGAQRVRAHGPRSRPGCGPGVPRWRCRLGRLAEGDGRVVRRRGDLPAVAGCLFGGHGGRGRGHRRALRWQGLDGDEHHRRGGGASDGRPRRGRRCAAGRLSGVGRLPPCGDGQHRHLRRLRAGGLRACPARAHDHGAADPAHGPARLGVGPQGGDQLPGDRQPGHALRGTHHLGGGRHGPRHGLRGDPDVVGQLVRP